MACTTYFITSLLIFLAGIARFNKDYFAKSIGILCGALVYCVFCFIVFGKLQGILPSQSVEQFISQNGYDASRLPITVSNLIQLSLIGGCVFNLFTVLAIWRNVEVWKWCLTVASVFCIIGACAGIPIGISPLYSLFEACCAFMASVAWVLGLTYVEFCVIGNIWIPCAAIIGTASFLVYASWRNIRSCSGMAVVWSMGSIIFAFLQIIAAILLLYHYQGTMSEAFHRCIHDLNLLARYAHTSYEVVNIFIWVFMGTALLAFNIAMRRHFIKQNNNHLFKQNDNQSVKQDKNQPVKQSMKKKIVLAIIAIILVLVAGGGYYWWVSKTSNPWNAKTVGDIPTPSGFERDKVDDYGQFLRSLPLKKQGAKVHLYTGGLASLQWLSVGVIDIPVLSNYEQCADMTMRIRAEYFWKHGFYSKIRFTDVNGKLNRYSGGSSRKAFEKYMKRMYGVCSTYSVLNETKERSASDVKPGDVFVFKARKGRSLGHAILVADVATNAKGQKAVLCIEGNTPAREAHVLRNFNPLHKAWFIIDDSDDMFLISCFRFNKNELRHY